MAIYGFGNFAIPYAATGRDRPKNEGRTAFAAGPARFGPRSQVALRQSLLFFARGAKLCP